MRDKYVNQSNPDSRTEAELLTVMASQDQSQSEIAWGVFCKKKYEVLSKVLKSVLFGRDSKYYAKDETEVIHDLVTSTFEEVKKRASSFKKERLLSGNINFWLISIAKNIFKQRLAQSLKEKFASLCYDENSDEAKRAIKRQTIFSEAFKSEVVSLNQSSNVKVIEDFIDNNYNADQAYIIRTYYNYYDSNNKTNHIPKPEANYIRIVLKINDVDRNQLLSRFRKRIISALDDVIQYRK